MKKIHRVTAGLAALALAAGCTMPAFAAAPVSRDENVFVTLNPDGSVQSQTVSVWLHCDDGLNGYTDKAEIQNPKNLKGRWKLEQKGNQLTMTGEGQDVYYQGTTEKTPPITVSIQYELDGTPITAPELLGKAGHVTIRMTLTNHEAEQQKIGGRMRTVYTPMAAAIAVNLPADHFTDVRAENGTVQTDSLNQLAAFVALPGMRENFDGLLPDQMDDILARFHDEIVIEADTDEFVMPMMMVAAAASLEELQSELPDELGDLDEMDEKLTQLKEATRELQDGVKRLKEATASMQEGAKALDQAVGTLKDGAGKLDGGARQLSDGASALQDGTSRVADGAAGLNSLMGQLCQNNDMLNQGAGQLFGAVLKGAEGQLNQNLASQGLDPVTLTPDGYQQTIEGLLAQLGQENIYAQARAKVEAQVYTPENREKATKLVRMNYAAAILVRQQNPELSEEEARQKAAEMLASPAGIAKVVIAMQLPAMKEALAGMDQAIQATVDAQLAAKVEEALAPGGAAYDQLQQALGQADAASRQLNELLAQLGQAQGFVKGVADYTGAVSRIYSEGTQPLQTGAAQAKEGAAKLNQGAKDLSNATATLVKGAGDLKEGTKTLVDGSIQLSGGAVTLSDGMNQYAEEGIAQLTDGLDELGLDGIREMADAMQQQMDAMTGYTGVDPQLKSSVKFVMKTGEVEPAQPETEAVEEKTEQEELTLWQRIKNLFR